MSNYGYHKITLYPGVKYKYLAASAARLEQCEINKINSLNGELEWSDIPAAFLLANYSKTIDSVTPDEFIDDLTGWRIYRQRRGSNIREFVGEIDSSNCGIEDYMCANQTSYTYYIYPIINNKIGHPIKTSEKDTDWWNYALIGFKQDTNGVYSPYMTWLFDCNLTSAQIVQNLDITKFGTFSRTPKISKGQSNYQTMGVVALLGGISYEKNQYVETMDALETWQQFVGECDLCIWKDRKGAIKIGTVIDNPTAQYIDEISKQPTQIAFNFVETADTSDFKVFTSISPYSANIINKLPADPNSSGGNQPGHN